MELVRRGRVQPLRLLAATGLIVALGTLASVSGPAAEACENATTTAEMVRCAGEALDAANEDLVEAYDRLHARLDPERRAQLDAAQDAWKIFRERNADFAASAAEGGTLYPVLRLTELLEMTQHRTDELRARLEK